jgi:hypothetical protein
MNGNGIWRGALGYVRNHHLGLVAIFIALTGTAYAAQSKTAPKNSIVAKSIRKGAVTHSKLAPNSVTSSNVLDGSLTGSDVNAATLGTVPRATDAANADRATSAAAATVATNAGNADKLGGSAASAYLKGTDAVPGGQLGGSYAAPTLRGSSSASTGAETLFAPDACDATSSVSGPSVTITVPASGFVEFLARVQFQTVGGNSLTACIVEDGGSPVAVMSSTSLSAETRYTVPNSGTGTTTASLAQWTPVFTTPGVHSFELDFGRTGANAGVNQVSNRLLLVRALS